MSEPLSPRSAPLRSIALGDGLPASLRGAHVAIGNFDGMHRGHQAVLAATLDRARAEGRPALALTFEPHPRTFFAPDAPVFRLTPPAAKARLVTALGLDGLVVAPFDADLAGLSAEDFVASVRTLDRLLLSGFYAVPLYYLPETWLARSRDILLPQRRPRYFFSNETLARVPAAPAPAN